MYIHLFTPTDFKKASLNINKLNKETGKEWNYASNGKSALFHCLRSLGVRGTILLPSYVCESVLSPVAELSLRPIFYDLNSEDLNADISDIKYKISRHSVSCVVVASMYGNPADLVAIEKFCKEKEIMLIDDAAQSFGAMLSNRFVGTFGDAGFFSFSPGKPTAGHMGAFFWTSNNDYRFNRTKNCLIHRISYASFYYNRLKIYKYHQFKVFKILSVILIVLLKYIDIKNDDICKFENRILGGILHQNSDTEFRLSMQKLLINSLCNSQYIIIVKSLRGVPNNHKIVLKITNPDFLLFLRAMLFNKSIYCQKGYKLLNDCGVPVASKIVESIIEIPLEHNRSKMNYLIQLLSEAEFLYKQKVKNENN